MRRRWALEGAAPSTGAPSFLAALKSSPSKKGRGALLAVKPLGPSAAFSASQIPSEREDGQYDLRGARSYPTLEDEGDWLAGRARLRPPPWGPRRAARGCWAWGKSCKESGTW